MNTSQFEKASGSIDKMAKGNTGFLKVLLKQSLKSIKKQCNSEEEFASRCNDYLNQVCGQMGEEHREFYQNIINEIVTSL